jgi:ABC-2 type transport system ATP-binding protein
MADGHDVISDYRAARSKIGLVPQELSTDSFETVWATVSFSRGLFGKPADSAYIEKVLRDLSLWDKKDSKIMTVGRHEAPPNDRQGPFTRAENPVP